MRNCYECRVLGCGSRCECTGAMADRCADRVGAGRAVRAHGRLPARQATTPPRAARRSNRPVSAVVVQLLKDPAPVADFTVTDLNGRTISSADLRGKVVLVNFWATWCPPCRAEIPDLIKLQDKYRDQLVVLGISEDEVPRRRRSRRSSREQKMNYPVAMTTPELAKIFRGVVCAADDVRHRPRRQARAAPRRPVERRSRPSSKRRC